MKVKAVHKNARMAPRKIRPVATLVRGMSAQAALEQLAFLPGKAPEIVRSVLQSAVANAVNNNGLSVHSLKIVETFVNEGLVMKRFQPVSKGMAHPILKRSSHVTVVVDGEADLKKKARKSAKPASGIETISAGEYALQEPHDHEEEEQELTETASHKSHGDALKSRPVETRTDKETGEVFQKTKMMQQGGDKKKTHRRKSLGQ